MYSTDFHEEQSSRIDLHALRALTPVFFYFVSAGIVTVMLGPLLPELIQHWGIRDAQAGTLFLASFFGQLCGSWFAAQNLRASVLYGSTLTGIGCTALAWLNFELAHLAFFAIGLGLGAGLTAGNVIAGTILPSARTRLITMLNVAWGVGAIACPLLIRLTASGGMQRFLYVSAVGLAISSFASTTIPSRTFLANAPEILPQRLSRRSRLRKSGLPMATLPLLAFSAAMFLYIGVESSLGGWLPSYAIRTHSLLRASSVSLLFWTAELAGRLLVAALMHVMSESALYRVSLTLLILVEVLLCAVPNPSAGSVMALTVLAAISLAPVYPLILSFLLARTGNHAGLGVFFASASCGGAILPWLTGVFSTRFYGLRAGLIVPATCACLLLGIAAVITSRVSAKVEVQS